MSVYIPNDHMHTPPAATVISYLSALAGVVSGVTMNVSEWVSVAGVCFMALTYFTNLHYKRLENKRQQKVLELKEKAYGSDTEQ